MTISCVTYPERQQRRRVRQTIAIHKGNDNSIPNPQRRIRTWCFIIWFTTTCAVMVIISLVGYNMISSSDQDINNNTHRIHSMQHPFRRQQSQSQHDDRPSTTEHRPTSSLLENDDDENHYKQKEERILYIVTSIAEYDNGLRSTIEGNDRFTNTLVPVLLESVQSILSTPSSSSNHNPDMNQTLFYHFSIDVYLITHYRITKQRYQQLRSQLPSTVGLQIWDMATPYGYMHDTSWMDTTSSSSSSSASASASSSTTKKQPQVQQQQQQPLDQRLQYHTRGLSRQHRYVIKDKLYYYDYFINVEDDMLIHSDQVQHYIQMSNSIYQLRHHSHQQPNGQWSSKKNNHTTNSRIIQDPSLQFYGPMTEHQLGRTIPGLIRVEVVMMHENNNKNNSNNDNTKKETNDGDAILTVPTLKIQHPLLDYFQNHPIPKKRKMYYNIPMDYTWDITNNGNTNSKSSSSSSSMETEVVEIDASICCHVTNHTWQQQLRRKNDQNKSPLSSSILPPTLLHTTTTPPLITANDLYFWEMNIESLGVRRMPIVNIQIPISHHTDNTTTGTTTTTTTTTSTNHMLNDLDWVMLLGGSNNELFQKINDPSYIIGDYWSGRYMIDTTTTTNHHQNVKNIERPDRRNGKYVNNQGGWFGTRRQIIEWHTRWCRGSFLPPYDLPTYRLDGLDGRSVEYWSGGIQLVGINACNLQRIVALRPEYFSKHLLYHTSNNKQRSNTVLNRFSRHSIQEFWGQINTVRKHAERTMNKELGLL